MEKIQHPVPNTNLQKILLGGSILVEPILINTYDDVDGRYKKAMAATDEEFARLIGRSGGRTAAETETPPELQEV